MRKEEIHGSDHDETNDLIFAKTSVLGFALIGLAACGSGESTSPREHQRRAAAPDSVAQWRS